MIKEIDDLMMHWGEQFTQYGLGAGIGSQMGTIMEWKGCAPRGTPGARDISGGTGIDFIASEIDAAVAKLERGSDKEQTLAVLAIQRYLYQTPVREQMRALGLAEGADRTYRNRVTRLHQQVMIILADRSSAARGSGAQLQRHSFSRAMAAKLGRAQA